MPQERPSDAFSRLAGRRPRPVGDLRHRRQCPACVAALRHPDAARRLGEVERRYVAWWDPAELARELGISPADWDRHCAHYGLDAQRAGNLDSAYQRALERALRGEAGSREALSAVERLRALRAQADDAPAPAADDAPGPAAAPTWEQAIRAHRADD